MLAAAAYASGLAAGGGLIVAIGAQNAFVLRQGLKREHVGLVVACCIFGDILCITLGATGMGAVVKSHPAALEWLRWGGAAYLAYFAYGAAVRSIRGGESLVADARGGGASAGRVLLACLGFTFLNPHVYLDTVVLLGSIAASYGDDLRPVFAAGACSASVIWFTALGFGARLLTPLFARPSAWRVLDGFIAVFMAALAVGLALNPLA